MSIKAHSLGFYGDGISFWVLWPIILTQSPSWWHMHCLAKMEAREGFWEVIEHVVSSFDLSRTLLVGLLVLRYQDLIL